MDSTPNKGSTPPEEPPASDEPDDSDSDSITGLPDKGYTGEAWGFGSAEICATGEIGGSSDRNSEMSTEEYCDETAEFGMTLDEALDTEEAAPEREITIVFSGGDWVSYAGERYTLCKRKPPEGIPVNAWLLSPGRTTTWCRAAVRSRSTSQVSWWEYTKSNNWRCVAWE